MMVDSITKTLFYPFFRRVGNPYQKLIHNIREFKQFIIENNGINDCFIAIYDERYTIDKIFFDLDVLDIKLAYKFYKFLTDNDYCTIPVFSGKKGFHFYVLLKPMRFHEIDEAIASLRRVSYTLIDEAGMYKYITVKKDDNTEEDVKVPLVDGRIIGDIRRLTRVPNTLRVPDNLTYCCVLPPDFGKMSLEELFMYAKSPHYFNNGEYVINRKYKITDLPNTDVIYDYINVTTNSGSQYQYFENKSSINIHRLDTSISTFLKLLLRPCLFYWITTEEPPHDIRTAVVIDLLSFGFSPDEIVAIFERLKWVDYKYSVTRYHVYHLARKGLKRYSCRSIKEIGCCIPDCDRR